MERFSLQIGGSTRDTFFLGIKHSLSRITKWFTVSKLLPRLDKTNMIHFIMNNSPPCPLSVGYNVKYIEEYVNAQFVGSQIDNHLKRNSCIDELTNVQHVMSLGQCFTPATQTLSHQILGSCDRAS